MSDLFSSIRSHSDVPMVRMNVYGTDGIGKTTMAAGAPRPILIDAEDGAKYIKMDKFPVCVVYDDVIDAIDELAKQPHNYKTVVLDTTDAVERLCQDEVKQRHNIDSIEKLTYGKGFVESSELFANILRKLEALSLEKSMHIILLSHVQIRVFSDPEREPYDRYEMNTHRRISSLIRSWVDFNFFANHEITTVKSGDGFRQTTRGVSYSDHRYLFTQRTAAYDAKSRLALDKKIPLSWAAFIAECKGVAKKAADAAKKEAAKAANTLKETSPSQEETTNG